jgi:hypothetical protein
VPSCDSRGDTLTSPAVPARGARYDVEKECRGLHEVLHRDKVARARLLGVKLARGVQVCRDVCVRQCRAPAFVRQAAVCCV